LRIQEAPHVNKDYTPITVFLLSFMEVIQLLVAETNKYYSQYLDLTITADTTCRCNYAGDVHLSGNCNTNGTWCQGHTES
jgi:hypothetical protein